MGSSVGPGPRGAWVALRAGAIGCMLALASAAGASAQDLRPAAPAAPAAQLDADLVRTGLYLIRGGGGNSLLRLSANGMVLVDGKLPGNYRALMSQVRRISKLSDMSVRAVILTDHRADHAGTNAQFVAAHIPIVAQRNGVASLDLPEATVAGNAASLITYDREYILRIGGVEMQLLHFGNGRTADDTVVYFPDLRIVAIGDLFAPGAPEPDFRGGGSLVGWGPVLEQILKLDFDQVVPGTGPVVGRQALEAFKAKVDTVVSRGRALVGEGVGRDDLMARLRTEDLGWHFDFGGDELDRFYAELSAQH